MTAKVATGPRFHRLHTGITYAIAGLGLFALTRGDQVGGAGIAVFAIGYVASLFLGSSRPRAPQDLTRQTGFWNGLMLAALALQIARFFLGQSILPLAFELAGALQIAKLFNRNTAKDHQQIQALAFLHLIGASVLTTGLDYALVFLGFVILMPWMLALSQMRAEIERHYGGGAAALETELEEARRRADTIARVLRSRRIAGPRFLLGTAALALPLFAVTAAFFLLFPRVGLGFLNLGDTGGQPVAGFGSNVELGNFGVIRDDPTVILRIAPSDLGDSPPERRSYRLRGTAFDEYRDARWSRTEAEGRRIPAGLGGFYALSPIPDERADRSYEIVLDPLGERVVFLLPQTIALTSPPRIEGGIDRARVFEERFGREIRYGDPDGLPLRYTVFVADEAPVVGESLTEPELERYLQLPEGQERVAALARRLAPDGDPGSRAERLETWLRESGELSYSLELPDTHGDDPLEVFLFEAKRGHCEYFSTALAVMLRTQGIPSRNVTGFVGGAYNGYGRYYAVQQGDAHSWVEAWIEDRWVVLDPTPAARREAVGSDGWLAEVRALMDALRMRWARDVVGYDLRDQVDGLRSLFRFFRSLRGEQRRGLEAPSERNAPGKGPWIAGVGAALLMLALVVWWRARRRQRGPIRTRPSSPSAQEATRLYEQLERRLAKLGHPRPPARTVLEHAEALRSAELQGYDLVDEITTAYLDARYGGAPLAHARRRALVARLGEISGPDRR